MNEMNETSAQKTRRLRDEYATTFLMRHGGWSFQDLKVLTPERRISLAQIHNVYHPRGVAT